MCVREAACARAACLLVPVFEAYSHAVLVPACVLCASAACMWVCVQKAGAGRIRHTHPHACDRCTKHTRMHTAGTPVPCPSASRGQPHTRSQPTRPLHFLHAAHAVRAAHALRAALCQLSAPDSRASAGSTSSMTPQLTMPTASSAPATTWLSVEYRKRSICGMQRNGTARRIATEKRVRVVRRVCAKVDG